MSDRTKATRWALPRTARAAIIVAAALAVLAAACSRGPSSTSGAGGPPKAQGSANPSTLAFSACMRTHGVPSYPDPDSSGQLPKGDTQQFGVSASQFQAAQQACQHLLPTDGSTAQEERHCMDTGDCSQAVVQTLLGSMRRFSACMRTHGFPNMPDPTLDSEGRPVFAIDISKDGFDPGGDLYRTKEDVCQRLTGGDGGYYITP
jgi:hypothetical protein